MSDFLHMGGYAAYVWSAYGISLAVLLVNVVLPLRRERQVRDRISKRLQRERQE